MSADDRQVGQQVADAGVFAVPDRLMRSIVSGVLGSMPPDRPGPNQDRPARRHARPVARRGAWPCRHITL
ncbi:hypothetical protein [Streptomyces kaempferi]|uniref:Uncharacterized protein n=1 Tax=Streptomyces kaempferi TaxID=333725 RepID=A0ABW3XSU0_9ACTN